MAFWHRARAKRVEPRIRSWHAEGSGLAAFAGYKAGMARVLLVGDSGTPFAGQEVSTAVTVVEVPPLFVYAITAYEKTFFGLKKIAEIPATNAPKQLKRSLTPAKKSGGVEKLDALAQRAAQFRVIACSQPFKASFGKKAPDCLEIPLRGPAQKQLEFAKSVLGKEVAVSQVFKPGEYVDAIAVTKGKGWQGVVKRMGVSLNPHKATKSRRHGGSIGAERQAKVFYTIPRSGQQGFHRRTDENKRVLAIAGKQHELAKKHYHAYGPVENDFLLVAGSVPGPSKRFVVLRKSLHGLVKEPQVKQVLG